MTHRESRKVEIKPGAPIPGLVLAGGLSRRMGGGDKSLRLLGSKPLILHVIERFARQASPLAINANGNPDLFLAYGLPVIPDADTDFAGPLAGILASLRWAARAVPEARFLATAACDTPFFPDVLVARLLAAVNASSASAIAVAASDGRLHPIFALWPMALADELAAALASGERKVTAFIERRPHIVVEFPFIQRPGRVLDPFFNINTPDEFAEA